MTTYKSNFVSTYLYIKHHRVTGLLYFGKTTKKDPIKYLGSGTVWSRHIKKHGKDQVETLWFCLFTEVDELSRFALMFSEQNDIVRSTQWANLVPENGLDGKPPGTLGVRGPRGPNKNAHGPMSEEHKALRRGKRGPMSEEQKALRRGKRGPQVNPCTNRKPFTDEHISNMRGPKTVRSLSLSS